MSDKAKLKELEDEERALRTKLGETRRKYGATALRLINANLPADLSERGAVTTPFTSMDIEVPRDGWECDKSPTGMCVYHPKTDPALDDCIYCHDPYERK